MNIPRVSLWEHGRHDERISRRMSIKTVSGKLLIAFGVVIVVVILGLFIILLIASPGTMRPTGRAEGSIMTGLSEKIFVDINGAKQGMFIQSENIDFPVLLFVHGGPGMPEIFLNEKYPIGLEKHFTVCWWEQRAAGISYRGNEDYGDITVDQLIEDTISVSNYLSSRFGKEKIYLMGHSWGSFIALQAAARKPDIYVAYIGVGQLSHQSESEIQTYAYMIREYTKKNNRRALKKLSAYHNIGSDKERLLEYCNSLVRDQSMHELGIGTMHGMKSVISGIFFPVMGFRGYTIIEKINLWIAKAKLKKYTDLRRKVIETDLSAKIAELSMPVYFISGKFDYTVSWEMSKKFLDRINAPVKGFYGFDESAHSPMFEERERFLNIMVEDVLKNRTNSADEKIELS